MNHRTGRSRSPLQRRLALLRHRAQRLDPTVKGLLWVTLAGLIFVQLNTIIRLLSLQMHPLQAQFLRYISSVIVMAPWVMGAGLAAYMPKRMGGQFVRGGLHSVGLMLWFTALPQIPMADTTAIGFTGPIFIMLGAYLFFREQMRWDRWLAALLGFVGVLIVLGPSLTGGSSVYSLVMLASSPIFAASFLLTKALTRTERVEVIVLWQAISVSLFSLPLAIWFWAPVLPGQWLGFLAAGVLGVAAHYSVTRGFAVADISSTQSVKFLDLVWAAAMGWLVFGETPSQTTLIGGLVICGATIWIARREARGRQR
ncbi:MAG: DMT family transporter [Rhodoferax sp.]|nr:DMT family transporter [Rhodoferax sp.]